jgi:hypothetical protein
VLNRKGRLTEKNKDRMKNKIVKGLWKGSCSHSLSKAYMSSIVHRLPDMTDFINL